jgi:hypothetical protein
VPWYRRGGSRSIPGSRWRTGVRILRRNGSRRASLRHDGASSQENIDTTMPQSGVIFTVMASLAQSEGALTSERVKAGMARAKAQGKRPPGPRLPSRCKSVWLSCLRRGSRFSKFANGCALHVGQRGTMSNGSRHPLGGRSCRLGPHTLERGMAPLSVTSVMPRGPHKIAGKEGTTSVTGERRWPEQPLRR